LLRRSAESSLAAINISEDGLLAMPVRTFVAQGRAGLRTEDIANSEAGGWTSCRD